MAEVEARLRGKSNDVHREVAEDSSKIRARVEAERLNIDRAEAEARAKAEADIKENADKTSNAREARSKV